MLLTLIGLMAGGLLGVAVSSARVAARALAETPPTRSSKDWLSPEAPAGAPRGEPAGSQGEDSQPVDASRPCENSRSTRRAGTTSTLRTPHVPPRRNRRNPSAGWAQLFQHPFQHTSLHGLQIADDRSIPPRSQRSEGWPRPPREEGEEQWTWG